MAGKVFSGDKLRISVPIHFRTTSSAIPILIELTEKLDPGGEDLMDRVVYVSSNDFWISEQN